MLARGWSEKDIQKLAGLNLIRVFKAVEQVNYSLVEEKEKEKRIISSPVQLLASLDEKSGRVSKVEKSRRRKKERREGENGGERSFLPRNNRWPGSG